MKNIQLTKTGLVIVNKNNTINVYTLKEYTEMKYYKKLYRRIYQILCIMSAALLPGFIIQMFK